MRCFGSGRPGRKNCDETVRDVPETVAAISSIAASTADEIAAGSVAILALTINRNDPTVA